MSQDDELSIVLMSLGIAADVTWLVTFQENQGHLRLATLGVKGSDGDGLLAARPAVCQSQHCGDRLLSG